MSGKDPRRKKLLALLEREGFSSYMSDTKWMRLIEELRSFQLSSSDHPLRYRIKLLTDSDVSEWDTGFAEDPHAYVELPSLGPVLALEIEWLEIDATGPWLRREQVRLPPNHVDYSAEIASLLEALRVPFSRHDTLFRVTGHLQRNQSVPQE